MRRGIPACFRGSSSCYIAEDRVKATLSDLDRLIRLEEFLKDEQKAERTKIILEWADSGKKGDGERADDCDEADQPD